MCVEVGDYEMCDADLYRLFSGEDIVMADGHHLQASFEGSYSDEYTALCRRHNHMDICLENIVDLYAAPHDCIMIANHWHCRDEMINAWRTGCMEVDDHEVCGPHMIQVVLQGCIDIDDDWVCPTAVGTKHSGYNSNNNN